MRVVWYLRIKFTQAFKCRWKVQYLSRQRHSPVFWNGDCCIIGSIRMNILMLDTRNVEQTKDVRMYTWRIYSSRYLDTLLHKVELKYIGKMQVYIHSQSKEWEMWELLLTRDYSIELQLHEKLSHLRLNLWSVIPLFASLITPGGVNGNLCRHLAHQTAGETIEWYSCN